MFALPDSYSTWAPSARNTKKKTTNETFAPDVPCPKAAPHNPQTQRTLYLSYNAYFTYHTMHNSTNTMHTNIYHTLFIIQRMLYLSYNAYFTYHTTHNSTNTTHTIIFHTLFIIQCILYSSYNAYFMRHSLFTTHAYTHLDQVSRPCSLYIWHIVLHPCIFHKCNSGLRKGKARGSVQSTTQGTFREHSGNIQGTFTEPSGTFSVNWADAREPPSQLQEAL